MILPILVTVAVLFIIVLVFALSRKMQSPKYDYDHTLGHVFELTWEYFKSHPSTDEFTEVHSANGSFRIIARGTADCHKYVVSIASPDGSKVYNKEFEGPDAEKKVEAFLFDDLKLQNDYCVHYQITALGGPEVFYEREH